MKIFGSKTRRSPDKVFTPRSAEINKTMYIERSELQSALRDAACSNYHVILFGQSGSGKTWLYKSVLSTAKMPSIVANLANAKRFKSISGELENLIGRLADRSSTTSKTSEFEINIADVVRKKWGKNVHLKRIKDPFEELLIAINKASSDRRAMLVLDNLETIIDNQDLMDELGNLIILLDDESYARYKVKLLVVGVPGDVKDYFQRIKNLKTVANRLIELPEVARMTPAECDSLVEKGFQKELGYSVFRELAPQFRTVG